MCVVDSLPCAVRKLSRVVPYWCSYNEDWVGCTLLVLVQRGLGGLTLGVANISGTAELRNVVVLLCWE